MDIQKTEKRIDQAIRLLQAYNRFTNLTLAYSGGKDSDVVLQLCRIAHVPVDIVHNCTTIDPPGTLSYCQSRGAIINRPKQTFFQLIDKKGLPSMFRRFCCKELKEQYIAKHLVLGIRADESNKRKKRYKMPSSCFVYSSKLTTEQVLPIVFWNLVDELYFIEQEMLRLNPYYYQDGYLNLNRRVGCIGCPLQSDRGRADFIQYPKFLRQWCHHYANYVSTHKAIEGVYEDIVWHIFYSNHGDEKYKQTYHGLFPAQSAKDFLQEYFNCEL